MRSCKHAECWRCRKLSVSPRSSLSYVCCRCRDLHVRRRIARKPRKRVTIDTSFIEM